jgi:hypothetical protein
MKRHIALRAIVLGLLAVALAVPAGPPARAQTAAGQLSVIEVADLQYMREEEKLGYDVSVALYAKWGTPVFSATLDADAVHVETLRTLLERFGLQDLAASNGPGVFTNPTLADRYNALMEEGSASLAEALNAGGAMGETEILDLEKSIAETDQPEVRVVYQNLLRDSHDELRAFVSNLKTHTGETYVPRYLSQSVYDAIVGYPAPLSGPRP